VLDERSDALAASLLEPLTGSQRDRLLAAMRDVERLLTAATVELRAVDPEHPDARQCVRAYFTELARRSGGRFDPATSVVVEPDQVRPPAGIVLVAYLRSEPVGCGAVKQTDGPAAEIKRMWVSEQARGLGIGRRLLAELEARAAAGGAARVRLDTSALLHEAIAMYRSAGYVEVPAFTAEPFADHWFEKTLR
jgi:ribosomal protein S18 acetylase RimI-like enzyme